MAKEKEMAIIESQGRGRNRRRGCKDTRKAEEENEEETKGEDEDKLGYRKDDKEIQKQMRTKEREKKND